jgi:hypothetical protein
MFKPKNANGPSNGGGEDTRNFPVPRSGQRKARVSLIVDLGEQNREPFEDPVTGEFKPQKPCQQLAVFADLTHDTVDYGGTIGKQHYRMLLNKSFQGAVVGVNFQATPPKDAKGNLIAGKKWGFHPANLLTKLAKAVGKDEVIESMDVEQLLDLPFMCQVEVKITDAKNDKKDADGKPIQYKNVNFKAAAPLIEDDDGNLEEVNELATEARCITFDSATVEDIKFIRGNLIKQIKLANDYAGSQMQAAIEEFEAKQKAGNDSSDEGEDEPEPAPAKTTKPATAAKKPAGAKKPPVDDELDEQIPF